MEEEIPEDFGLQNASQKCHIFGRLLFFMSLLFQL